MGLVSEICVGKTATLTKNDMTVNSFYVAGKMVQVKEERGILFKVL